MSTLAVTLTGIAPATLTIDLGTPGPQGLPGPTGSQGPTGPAGAPGVGVPAGGLAGQYLVKTSGVDFATGWQTLSLSGYLSLDGGEMNANAEITFEDTSLGRLALASGSAFAVSSSSNPDLVSNLLYDRVFVKNATSQTSIIPTGVEFPDLTIQTTGFTGWNNVALTGNPTAPTAALADNDSSIATTAFVQQELLSGTANARNLEVYVRNQTGSTLAAGSIVYINGATGNRPTVTPAQANNDANSAQTFGFVKTSIANNGFGFVIIRGEVENLDTSALTEGVQLYLSPTTAGAYTTTKPSAPQHLVYVGIVVRAHPTQGVILAAIQNGYEVEELHNASINSVANNDLFVYESATSLWKNKSFGTLGLLTSATAASTYLPLNGGTLTGQLRLPNSTASLASLYIYPGADPASPSTGDIWVDGNGVLRYRLAGVNEYIAYRSWVTSGFALKASPALTGNVTITSNSASPALVITQDGTGDIVQFKDVTSDTTYAFIDANGKVGTIASTTAGAGFNIAHGVAPTTFVDGDVWSTTGGLFWRQNGATKQAMNLGDTQTVSGNITFSNTNLTFGNNNGGSTTNVAVGPTNSGTIKTVNIGTNGVSGSTTNITVGPVAGASTTSIGNTTAASTLNLATGATLTATTKAVNIGTSGVSGSTTNITIGSTTGTSTTTLQGITNGVTQTAGDSSTKLATTAFVTTAGFIGDAPSDGSQYARKNGAWDVVSGGGGTVWGSITGNLSDQTDLLTQFNNTNSAVSAKWTFNFSDIVNNLTMGSASSVGGASPGSGDVLTYNSGQISWSSPSSGSPYYNSVWVYGGWYSANTTNIYDSGSGSYYNVLTF